MNEPSPDTGFEIRALSLCGQARYLSVMSSPHNPESLGVVREKIRLRNMNAISLEF